MQYKFDLDQRVQFETLSKKEGDPKHATGKIVGCTRWSDTENSYQILPDKEFEGLFDSRTIFRMETELERVE